MDQHFLKITYHATASKKMNAYLKMPSPIYNVLKKEIDMCLFDERKQPRCEIRTFWIDEDQDEIEIITQVDYDIFLSKRSERHHLQVAPIGLVTEELSPDASTSQQGAKAACSTPNATKIPPAAGSYEFAVHSNVECDACLMAPIMGFRYKCIQCPNYDLCQNCEAKHVHSEHMMVRMPTNNCPNVVEAYITGRTSSRRHGKRSKSGTCPFVARDGISVVIDDEAEAAGAEQTSTPTAAGKERHRGRRHAHRRSHGNNFLSHIYEMMHDLAEGGGAAAAAAAMGGETATTSSATTGPSTTTTTTTGPTTSTSACFENLDHNIAATVAANAAQFAAQKAHETAVKSAELAAKVAHETALQAAKTATENNAAPAAATATAEEANGQNKEKVDATTSPSDFQSQPNAVPLSPSLETLAQFLDPQYMKTGIQILNNFSDMFAKMLDPMDGAEGGPASCPFAANSRKNSATSSSKSSVSSNLNSMESDQKSEKMSSEKNIETNENKDKKQTESDASSQVEIDDLGSDSENESEPFIKLDAPKEPNNQIPNNIATLLESLANSAATSKAATATSSAQTTPPQSLNKSNVMDFAQLSADLKAHIAEENGKNTVNAPIEIAKAATQQLLAEEMSAATPNIPTASTNANEPLVAINTTTATTTTSSTSTNTTSTPNKPEEKRAVPVYHTDHRINNSVHAMMAMGFSNEGAWLTQLLESVNGNIAEALDLMTVAQRSGH